MTGAETPRGVGLADRLATRLAAACLAVGLAGWLASCAGDAEPPAVARAGLLVEAARDGGAVAGVRAGDRLTAWRLEDRRTGQRLAAGLLRSEPELIRLRDVHMPRGSLTLIGVRGGEHRSWALPRGEPAIEARPPLPPRIEARYLEALELAANDAPAAAQKLDALARGLGPALASFLHARAAGWRDRSGRWSESIDSHEAAAEAAAAAGRPWDEGVHLFNKAMTLSRRLDQGVRAEQLLDRVRQLWSRRGLDELAAAKLLTMRGELARRRGELDAAASHLDRALAIKRRLVPESLSTALSLSIAGKVAGSRGQLDLAEQLLSEARTLRRRFDPDGKSLAHSYGNLGTLLLIRGDLSAGERNLLEALTLFEKEDPTSDNVGVMLGNLGVLARQRGDLVSAEQYLRRALSIAELESPGGLEVADNLHNLAVLAFLRGRLEQGAALCRRALEINRRQQSGKLDEARNLGLLAQIEAGQGNVGRAAELLEEVLEIERALAPSSSDEAQAEYSLARLEMEQGRLESARRRLQRADALLRNINPRHAHVGQLATALGGLELLDGRLRRAERHFLEAIDILVAAAPGTDLEIEAHWGLARLHDAEGRSERALESYRRAEQALELQQGRLGGGQEVEARFRAGYRQLNRRRVELELEAGRVGAAFEALESFRARVLLALLAERDLVLADLAPELDTQRRRAATRLDRAQAALLSAPGGGAVEKSLAELEEARQQLRLIREQVRQAEPRFSFVDSRPSGAAEALSALDAGTVALVYALAPSSGTLFVLEAGAELTTRRLAIGGEDLARRVERFRLLMRSHELASTAAELSALARDLYGLLIAPAEHEVQRAERLLIVPDGALHLLPFAALEAPGDPRPERFLGVARPLHAATSLAVYGRLKRRRGDAGASSGLVAFADPGPRSKPVELERGRDGFSPLPASRGEAWAIKRRFPETEIFLGRQATEGRARGMLGEAELVHFAVHGFLDERYPLSSGLVLAEDGTGSGLLQAWEIFEGVRTEAGLVVLSGCETAIGSEVDGEGLLGLTRAFHWAGARSVLASLWRVSDRGTAALMDRLYHHLAAGRPVSVALQRARGDLLAGAVAPPAEPAGLAVEVGRRLGLVPPPQAQDFSHPVYWSGFRLDGDWR